MAINYNYFTSPEFQKAWAYGDRSQQSLGLDDENYGYLKSSNFQPFQPNAMTNVQNIGGQWKNTVVQPGQTAKDFAPAPTSAPATPAPQSAYGANISQTLPGGSSSIVPKPAPVAAAAPPNPWVAQPKPASEMMAQTAAPTAGTKTAGVKGNAMMAGVPQAFQLPPGFDVRAGGDQATNQQVYGSNYFPGGLPGFDGVVDSASFFQLSPEMQGNYREALYGQYQQSQGQGPTPAAGTKRGPEGNTTFKPQPTYTPPAPVAPHAPVAPPFQADTPTPPVGATSPGVGATNAMYPGGRGNYNGYGPNGGGLRVDPTYLPEFGKYEDTPEFQRQLELNLRGANRRLLAMGRSDSTGGINALNNVESDLRGQEVDKFYQRNLQNSMTNYGRMFDANQVNYGRTRGEDQTGWDRAAYLDSTQDARNYRDDVFNDQTGFRNLSFLDNAMFRNQNRDFNQNYQLADMGFRATQSGVNAGNASGANLAQLLSQNGANQASLALARGDVSSDQIQRLLQSGFGMKEIDALFGNKNSGGLPTQTPVPQAPGQYDWGLPNGQAPDFTQQQGGYQGYIPGYDPTWGLG